MNLTAYLSLVCLLILGGCAHDPEVKEPSAHPEAHHVLNGKFQGGDGVRITGALSEDEKTVERIWVTKDGERGGSVVASSPAHYSGLFALAQVAPKGE